MGQYLSIAKEVVGHLDKLQGPEPARQRTSSLGPEYDPTGAPAPATSCEVGLPSEWAEGIARLQTMSPPANVPPRRWEQFIDAAARFADRWAAKAAALGWGPVDIWGCHRDKPYERIDCAGLLWLLNGNEIVAMTTGTATVRTRTGAIQTFRRRVIPPDTVLAWDLGASDGR